MWRRFCKQFLWLCLLRWFNWPLDSPTTFLALADRAVIEFQHFTSSFWKYEPLMGNSDCSYETKVFKSGLSKFCGRQPFGETWTTRIWLVLICHLSCSWKHSLVNSFLFYFYFIYLFIYFEFWWHKKKFQSSLTM